MTITIDLKHAEKDFPLGLTAKRGRIRMAEKVTKIVVMVYLALVHLGIFPLFWEGGGPLSGIFAIILTLPWSVLVHSMIQSMTSFEGNHIADIAVGLLVIVMGAALNAVLIHILLRWLNSKFRKEKRLKRMNDER